MSIVLGRRRTALLAGCAIVAVAAGVSLGPRPAAAQFVCVGNATGATVGPATASGSGATAAGSGNFACGPGTNASGTGSGNYASGVNANASGSNNAFNLAIGTGANSNGDTGQSVAIGLN